MTNLVSPKTNKMGVNKRTINKFKISRVMSKILITLTKVDAQVETKIGDNR